MPKDFQKTYCESSAKRTGRCFDGEAEPNEVSSGDEDTSPSRPTKYLVTSSEADSPPARVRRSQNKLCLGNAQFPTTGEESTERE